MLVTLLTDFGISDTYVGQLKAALLTVAPRATIVDLTHDVPPQDVRAGAFHLWTAVAALKPPCIHVAVIDPGVGGKRHAVAARSRSGHLFVGPDNGLLWPAIVRTGGLDRAVELTVGPAASRTFHGRDIFAPAAGRLARGVSLGRLGKRVQRLASPFQLPSPGQLGEVAHIDRFGNVITSLATDDLSVHFAVRIGRRTVRGGRDWTYSSVKPGQLLALAGSSGLIEVAARDGSAAAKLNCRVGSQAQLL